MWMYVSRGVFLHSSTLQVDIEIMKGQKGKGKELGEAYEDQDSHSPLSGLAVLLNLFFYSTLLRKVS
jgi:hypothetical protein